MSADYSDVHDRSLIQIGDWHLVKTRFPKRDIRAACFAVHTECNPKFFDRYPFEMTHCHRCGDGVPDELQGLIALYHWGWEEQ